MTPLKHTYPIQTHLQGLTLCFSHSFHTRLKHTFGLLEPEMCFNARIMPEGKRHPLGPFDGAREGAR